MSQTEIRHSAFTMPHARRGFSLVELLTVIFIISLLIAILVPSLNSARNAAKKATTAKTLSTIATGLEMFKNDNGKDFPQTNGYPPSFAHPPITDGTNRYDFKPELGEFPFLANNPQVTGAHWLPAMLMGVDQLGYIKKSSVPNKDNLRSDPTKWYKPDPLGDGKSLERSNLYLDPGGTRTLATKKLPGRPNKTLFPGWTGDDNDPDGVQNLPVIVDAFDQAILYYAANAHGKPTNMVDKERLVDNNYDRGVQGTGPPFYFHQDNQAFTGTGVAQSEWGWDFGGTQGEHWIADSGETLDAQALIKGAAEDLLKRRTFARYILDRKIYSDLASKSDVPPNSPLRPVNSDTYLLISAGVDGRFGSNDDVANFPPFPEQ